MNTIVNALYSYLYQRRFNINSSKMPIQKINFLHLKEKYKKYEM